MGKFDTHGGYFAPKDYFRVNTGGSHEENPNGGVQIGMDGNGIPNMLEENEPVYKDYVYSDNIKAGKELLKKFNIPEKFAGKLYSEIADLFVDEASERPNDPISNNGLNAMLVRLANAQEEQKQLKEQKDLEEELSKLSPEELAELEQMLSQQQDGTGEVENHQAAVPEVGQEQMEIPQVMSQTPMMARGGFLRSFEPGGPLGEIPPADNTRVATPINPFEVPVYEGSDVTELQNLWDQTKQLGKAVGQIGVHFIPFYDAVSDAVEGDWTGAAGNVGLDAASLLFPFAKVTKLGKAGKVVKAADHVRDAQRAAKAADAAEDAVRAARNQERVLSESRKVLADYRAGVQRSLAQADVDAGTLENMKQYLTNLVRRRNNATNPETIKKLDKQISSMSSKMEELSRSIAGARGPKSPLEMKMEKNVAKAEKQYKAAAKKAGIAVEDEVPAVVTNAAEATAPTVPATAGTLPSHTVAGHAWRTAVNPFYVGQRIAKGTAAKGWSPWLRWPATVAGGAVGALPATAVYGGIGEGIDAAMTTWRDPGKGQPEWNGDEELDMSGVFADWDYAMGGPVRRFDLGSWKPSPWNVKLTGPLYDIPTTSYVPVDQTLFGVPELNFEQPKENLATMRYKLRNNIQPEFKGIQFTPDKNLFPFGMPAVATAPTEQSVQPEQPVSTPRKMYPTWPRYMGAITSGLTGLFDVFQNPDEYNIPAYTPVLPSGHMDIVDAQYNPLDQNQVVNGVIASGAGLMRGLGNSGLGPSTAAAMLAGDYNIGQNIGTGLAQVWDANNQRRNDVIGQHNAGAQARGQFNYGINRDRAQMINDARVRNIQNSLLKQRLNYAAEGDKYAAVSNQIDQVGQAISGIGNENFAMNQVNSMADYVVLPNGQVVYSPRARGGRLMRMYKEI